MTKALEAVEKTLLVNGTVPKAYKGYISSFGAGVVMSGLMPTLAIFNDGKGDDGRSEEDRSKVLDAIWLIMGNASTERSNGKHPLLTKAAKTAKEGGHSALRNLELEIEHAAIALKHALRCYHIDKQKN